MEEKRKMSIAIKWKRAVPDGLPAIPATVHPDTPNYFEPCRIDFLILTESIDLTSLTRVLRPWVIRSMDFGDALAAAVRCWSLRRTGCQVCQDGTLKEARFMNRSDRSAGSDGVIGPGQEGEANISAMLSGRDVGSKPQFSSIFVDGDGA